MQNIGACNYIDSLINYFVMFSTLGINIVGVVEIAKAKNCKEKLNEIFSTLLFVNVSLTVLSVVCLIIAAFSIEYLAPYRQYLLIGVSKLVFSALLVEWLFNGLSEFRYITLRSLAVRTLYVISIFCFVRSCEDTNIYYFLICISVVVNAVLNMNYCRRFAHFSFHSINIRPYVASIVGFGLYMFLTSMYTSFNVAFLGSTTDDTQVGYFTTATKLHGILLGVFSALTTVLTPKVSSLVAHKDKTHLKEIASKSFDAIILFSLPLMMVCLFYAPLIINLIAGKGYEGAIQPFRISIVLLLVIGLEQVVIRQFLLTLNKSKIVLILSLTGAVIGICLNVLFVPSYKALGAVMAWAVSELVILLTASYYFYKYFALLVPFGKIMRGLLHALPYALIAYATKTDDISIFTILGLVLIAVWFVVDNVYILHNSTISDLGRTFRTKLGICKR